MSNSIPPTGLQRIKVKAPSGINLGNKAQVDKLISVVEKTQGTGWRLASVDEEKREVHLARVSEVVSVKQSESRKDSFDVSLPREYKASDAERASAELESNPAYEGYVMTDFNPFLHIATLTRLSKEEIVARGYLAQTLGVKPWDIQVQATAAGGYSVKLPRQYVPAKHDDKLTEVVETAVGEPGWYIQFNPKERTAEIIPGDLPTFPAMIPFPLAKALKSGDNVMQFGEKLGANSNSPGGPAVIDFDAAAHSLLSGTSGSGKLLVASQLLPVPRSEKFPKGWARNDELAVGDEVMLPSGGTSRIHGFTDWETVPLYEVVLDDGQRIRVNGEHLWSVSRKADRAAATRNSHSRSVHEARVEEIHDAVSRLAPGTFMGVPELAQLCGMSESAVRQHATRHGIPSGTARIETTRVATVTSTQQVQTFNVIEAWPVIIAWARQKGLDVPVVAVRSERLPLRDIVGIATGSLPAREELQSVSRRLQSAGIRGKLEALVRQRPAGLGVRDVLLYDVQEFVARIRKQPWSDVYRVTSTIEMAGELSNGYALRVPEPYDPAPVPLSVDPYTLGAWLGDGDSRGGGFTGVDEETIREIRAAGYEVDGSVESQSWYIKGLTPGLRELGVLGAKHIPAMVLRASKAQRFAVLQGLMDTDGTISKSGNCEISLSDPRLAADTLELIRSLGIKASATTVPAGYRNPNGDYVKCKDRHRIKFTTAQPVFRLARKLARIPVKTRATNNLLYITDIRRVEPEVGRCLQIEDHLHEHLVAGFVPTHNSVTINAMIAWQLLTGHELVVIDLPHKAVDFTWCRDYVRDGGWGCDSLEASVAALEMVYREGMARAKVLKEHDVTKVDELPKHLRMKPIFVVVDELSGLLILEEVPRGLPKDSPMVMEANQINLLKQTLLNRIKKIAAELRFVKIRLLLSSQVSSTDTGVPTSLRMNLANKMLQGTNPTDNNRRLALSDALSVPKVPSHIREDPKAGKGVGVAELEGQTPAVYKGYYAPVSEYKKAIEARGVKKTTRPAPTPTEIAKYTPSIDEEDAQKGFGHKPRALEPWEIGPDGKPLTGFERANAAKHAATVGARG